MKDRLSRLIEKSGGDYVEARYHKRDEKLIDISKGEVEDVHSKLLAGVGIRVLKEGAWGFSSTSKLNDKALDKTLKKAEKSAEMCAQAKKEKIEGLREGKIAEGRYEAEVNDSAKNHSMEEKMKMVRENEERIRKEDKISSGRCRWHEMHDDKFIVNSYGSEAELSDEKLVYYVQAFSLDNGERIQGREAKGVTGGWKDIFDEESPEEMAMGAVKDAQELLKADHPEGGRATVVLNPELVALLSHEAIGHTVEADWVLSGSIVKGKIGEKVASEMVTLVDDGTATPHAGGWVPIDDEGSEAERTEIIKDGVLKNYLCDRETANILNMKPMGNSRAFEYSDQPIVRMTNTFIDPGDRKPEELVEEIDDGFYLEGAEGGQADANAEFMFGVQKAYRIENGEKTDLLRGVSISGSAFDVLESVDAVADDFKLDMGAGYCGKIQMAKVDGGGPHIRCKAMIGGEQEGK
ncbi:MAG: TldD/PmbA family protein [Candidatus Thermoplasmatota archaeon]|nr:TldD/PmbA family protein [Candidatus Thermoplasmatota archaeon]